MAKSVASSGAATPARPAKPFNSYLLNKCIIGYGVINGIINAVIFYLLHMGEPEALLGHADIFHDFALTGVLLGLLLFVIVVPLTRMDLRKHVFAGHDAAQRRRLRVRRRCGRLLHHLLRGALRQERGLRSRCNDS